MTAGREAQGLRRLAPLLAGVAAFLGLATAADAAVPVLCTVSVQPATASVAECLQQDTRASFTTIPAGQFLHVTDIVVTRTILATTGSFYALLGRDGGLLFPDPPRIVLSGTSTKTTPVHFATPALVLEAGDALAVYNDTTSGFPITVHFSGFISPVVQVPEPGARTMLLAGIGALSLLSALRRRPARSGGISGRRVA